MITWLRAIISSWTYYYRVRKVHRAINSYPLKLPHDQEIAPFALDDVLATYLTKHVDKRWSAYMDILRTSSLQALRANGYVLVQESCTLPVEAPLYLRRPPTEAEKKASDVEKKARPEPWIGSLRTK